jgi:NAD(P)-dependent dehydrogenase (short-subunit alcohol dehydrogenase family)
VQNDNILIIGANGSIGHSIVEILCKNNNVIATYNKNNSLKRFEGQVSIEKFDVSRIDTIDNFFDDLVKKYGPMKSMVYVAGVHNIKPIKFISVEDCRHQFDVNYFAPLFFSKAFSKKNAHTEGSSIVFISSLASKKPEPAILNYAASKAALDNLCIGLSKEIKPIRVNAVSPSFLKTNMTKAFPKVYTEEHIQNIENEYPLGIGSVNDIANMVEYLVSSKASYITGTVISVDGGASNL